MELEQAADYVAGILVRHKVEFQSRSDGLEHMLSYGSTGIFIRFSQWHADDTVISLQAVAVEAVPETARGEALKRINDLNCRVYFGKWCLYESSIKVEHDLIASKLQADELMNALSTVANQADENDDELARALGGKTWRQAETESRDEQEALDT